MVAYEYRCDRHGRFEVRRPMGEAPPTATCAVCQRDAARVYSAPMTSRAPAHVIAAIDHAEKSRDEPDVVTSLPPRPPRRRTPDAPANPMLRKLPRP